jgi:uncharacterized protein YdhG (YjbR/CyaY superfamily)
MKTKRAIAKTIDEYIAGFPQDVQERLQRIRATIRKAAPKAQEKISYGIAAYYLHGNLIFFAAFKNHLSVYPAPRGAAEFKDELSKYGGGKGTLQLPFDQRIPLGLIRRIVHYRVTENKLKAVLKRKKK